MARRVQWRRRQPDTVTARVEEALQKTFYIVHQSGPTSFVLKEEGKSRKYKTCLGDVHQCSCSLYRKDRELCVHILWVLLKKFRVSRDNSVIFQLGLVEREINEILHGTHTHQQQQQSSEQKTTPTNQTSQPTCVTRRDITLDDVCPICQEEFSLRPMAITYCKFGCGQNIHVKCMKIWSEHQSGCDGDDPVINCPICRGRFASLKELCSSDMCIYKPLSAAINHESPHSSQVEAHKRNSRDVERVNRVIAQLRAHPVTRDGVSVGRGGSCEMCGEVYKRGDWLKRLPCRHKFHRDCIDQWLRTGCLVCPIDGASVLPHKQQSQERERGGREGREARRGRGGRGEKYTKDNLTVSGKSIKLPHIFKTGSVGMVDQQRSQQPSLLAHDMAHDTLLPPLHPSPPSHPLTSHKSHPHSLTKKRQLISSVKKGLPSQTNSHTLQLQRTKLSLTSETSHLASCLSLSSLSPPPSLPLLHPPPPLSLSFPHHAQ